MTDLDVRAPSMSVRDLEQWLLRARSQLHERRIRGLFGRSPDLGLGDASTWISFGSDHGSGRLIRNHDGRCRVDAHRHGDGHVLLGESHPVTTPVELASIVDALTPSPPHGAEPRVDEVVYSDD